MHIPISCSGIYLTLYPTNDRKRVDDSQHCPKNMHSHPLSPYVTIMSVLYNWFKKRYDKRSKGSLFTT